MLGTLRLARQGCAEPGASLGRDRWRGPALLARDTCTDGRLVLGRQLLPAPRYSCTLDGAVVVRAGTVLRLGHEHRAADIAGVLALAALPERVQFASKARADLVDRVLF